MTLRLSTGVGIGIVTAVLVASACRSPYVADVLSYAVVLAIFAVAVGLTYGQLGYVSFGHAAFLGIGAYTVGILAARTGIGYWQLVPLSIVPGVVLGALIGWASVRVSGAYFAIATLTLAEMLRLIALDWTAVTRGPMGILVMVPALPWSERLGWNPQQAYLCVLIAVLGLVLSVLARLVAGPLGRSWTFIRQAPELAESIGIGTTRARVVNVALSGGIASLAGGLLIPKALVLSPDLFGTSFSAAGLLSVILGGKASLLGPVIGGLLFGVLPEALRAIDEYRLGLFALMLLVAVRLLPGGIVSLLPMRRWSGRGAAPVASAPTASDAAAVVAEAEQAPRAGDVVLAAESLTRRFGGVTAVRDVTFQVRRGELLGLIGPNGAGKTTCLSLLSGFLAPSAGDVVLDGRPIGDEAPNRLAARGLVRTFQHSAHCAELTVEQNVLHACHLLHREHPWAGVVDTAAYRERERARRDHARRCVAAVGLEERAAIAAAALPYGEQKLLGVAIALAARPHLLLLDEPAAGLNHVEGLRLGAVLTRLNQEGCTIVVVDHNLPLLMELCQRIVVFQHGEKIADDTPEAIARHERVLTAYLGVPRAEGAAA